MSKLHPAKGMIFESTKTYTHAEGLSCCFRQWRATHSHCQYLHGYALSVKLVFRTQTLDDRNWVCDFGGLKEIKQWLKDTFDHKTLIAKDDPQLHIFRNIARISTVNANELPEDMKQGTETPVIQLVEVDHVGCEAFAKMIYDHVNKVLNDSEAITPNEAVYLQEVEVKEHEGNSALYRRHS